MPHATDMHRSTLVTPVQGRAAVVGTEPKTESRLDAISDTWTIFAPQRAERPDDFRVPAFTRRNYVPCPFCAGNEQETPDPVWTGRIREDGGSDFDIDACPETPDTPWSVRVVPNKFPAVASAEQGDDLVTPDLPLRSPDHHGSARRQHPSHNAGSSLHRSLFRKAPVCGGHEVVIETPRHIESITELNFAEIELVFRAYQDRLRYYRELPHVGYTNVFKNVGKPAGASLSHSHSQVIATSHVPKNVAQSFGRMKRHRATTGCCLMCDLVREERRSRERIIARDSHSIAFCPFASHLPMLVRVTSLRHDECFENLSNESLQSVSRMVHRVISWLEQVRPGTPYNYTLSTKPAGIEDSSDAFHWSLDIFPRMTQIAGFEWASGCMINPMMPEQAAKLYRSRAISEDLRLTF